MSASFLRVVVEHPSLGAPGNGAACVVSVPLDSGQRPTEDQISLALGKAVWELRRALYGTQ